MGQMKTERIWEFFENLNEFVYVADMDTYELLYMNKRTLRAYGFESLEEIKGKKCHEVLHTCSTPCTICNNNELTEDMFREWQSYNPILDKHFLLKDTMLEYEGRRCRMEIAIDVSAQEKRSNMLQSYQNLELSANEGFRIALQASTPDESIDVILEYLGKALKGERTYIFEQNESGCDDNTYEWVANGVVPEKENLQNVPPEVCANWYRNFSENRSIVIEDIEDIREDEPLQYETLKRQNIHSLVVVPLYDDGKIIGFYGVDNPPRKSMDYAQNMLQIVGHFIISCLKRRSMLRQLQIMSYSDQLLGIGNRYAMQKYIAEIQQGESIGIVYCDVTGLKHINDTEGHEAGDRLLIGACDSLKRVFGDCGLFRIGGDEMLVLGRQMEETVLYERVEALKGDMRAHNVVMAVGAVWKKDYKANLNKLLSEAERLMYKDKAAFYRTAGVDRRQSARRCTEC